MLPVLASCNLFQHDMGVQRISYAFIIARFEGQVAEFRHYNQKQRCSWVCIRIVSLGSKRYCNIARSKIRHPFRNSRTKCQRHVFKDRHDHTRSCVSIQSETGTPVTTVVPTIEEAESMTDLNQAAVDFPFMAGKDNNFMNWHYGTTLSRIKSAHDRRDRKISCRRSLMADDWL